MISMNRIETSISFSLTQYYKIVQFYSIKLCLTEIEVQNASNDGIFGDSTCAHHKKKLAVNAERNIFHLRDRDRPPATIITLIKMSYNYTAI